MPSLSNRCPGMRGRAISAGRACECCLQSANLASGRAGQLLIQAIQVITAAVAEGSDPADMVLDPQEATIDVGIVAGFASPPVVELRAVDPVIRGVPRSAIPGALGVGAVVLLFAEAMASLRKQTAALEALAAVQSIIPPIVAVARRTGQDRCVECVRSRVWNQTSPRLYVTERHQTRKP